DGPHASAPMNGSVPASSSASSKVAPMSSTQSDPLVHCPVNHRRRSPIPTHHFHESSKQPCAMETSPTIQPTATNDWHSYQSDVEIEWNDMDLQTPGWMLDPGTNSRVEPIRDNAGAHTAQLMSKAPSIDWSPDQFIADLSSVRAGTTSSGQLSSQGRQSPPFAPSRYPDLVKTCIQEVAKLNERLLREKNGLDEHGDTEDLISGTPHVGRTLQHCREFLSILQRLHWACGSAWSESRADTGWVFDGEGSDRHSSRGSSRLSTSGKSLSASSLAPKPRLEIPTRLSILSCYAYILQSFDHLLTPILESLSHPKPIVPPILPGVQLDGFELDGDHGLQLECLVSVSLSMLEKIEGFLIGSPRKAGIFCATREGVPQDKLFAGWIDALYDQDDSPSITRRADRREVRAKRLIRQIKAILNNLDSQIL
ncbi:hypothetical protein QQS21_009655, partial [Conoideocrella luteorostrata]